MSKEVVPNWPSKNTGKKSGSGRDSNPPSKPTTSSKPVKKG